MTAAVTSAARTAASIRSQGHRFLNVRRGVRIPASVLAVICGRYSLPGSSIPLSTRNRSQAESGPKDVGFGFIHRSEEKRVPVAPLRPSAVTGTLTHDVFLHHESLIIFPG